MNKQTSTFPSIPKKNWWMLRNQMKRKFLETINSNSLATMLGIGLKAANNLIAPLKLIGFIDEKGKTTDRIIKWRDDQTYKSVCDEILNEVYPKELLDLFPTAEDLDQTKLIRWFMNNRRCGEAAAKQFAAMFSLLKSGEIENDITETIKSPSTKTKKPSSPIRKKEQPVVDASKNESQKKEMNVHVDFQIHISPEATNDQIESIFANMAKYLRN